MTLSRGRVCANSNGTMLLGNSTCGVSYQSCTASTMNSVQVNAVQVRNERGNQADVEAVVGTMPGRFATLCGSATTSMSSGNCWFLTASAAASSSSMLVARTA